MHMLLPLRTPCRLTHVDMQYTLILCASKKMPKQCLDYLTGQSRARRTVGVRMPGDPICQVNACKLYHHQALP